MQTIFTLLFILRLSFHQNVISSLSIMNRHSRAYTCMSNFVINSYLVQYKQPQLFFRYISSSYNHHRYQHHQYSNSHKKDGPICSRYKTRLSLSASMSTGIIKVNYSSIILVFILLLLYYNLIVMNRQQYHQQQQQQ
jgi:hypothetical protein